MKGIKFAIILGFLVVNCTNLFAQTNRWVVIMRSGTHAQGYKTTEGFPKSYINAEGGKVKYIDKMAYNNGKWTVVMSGLPYKNQYYYFLNKSLPLEQIRESWRQGFNITEVTYTNEQWFVVMSLPNNNSKIIREESLYKGTLNEVLKYIDSNWKYRQIGNITYGNNEWVVTMAKHPEYGHQIYRYQSSFPTEWLDKNYPEDYRVTSIAYGGGTWMVVMSKLKVNTGEFYTYNEEFPIDFIKSKWDDKYRINSIVAQNE